MATRPDKRSLRLVTEGRRASEGNPLLELTNRLARRLELADLLVGFRDEVGAEIRLIGILVESGMLDEQVMVGEPAPFSISRRLKIEERNLATVTFMCARALDDSGKAVLDVSMDALRYPLRNALLYAQALRCALRDPLTGVYNRAALDADLGRELRLALRYGQPLSLVRMLIDDIDGITSLHGEELVDLLVKSASGKLLENVRNTDRVFRYAQDEFVIALNGTNLQGGSRVAERIRDSIEALRLAKQNVSVVVSVSIGLTDLRSSDDAPTLIGRAGEALEEARTQGRGRIVQR